MTENPYESPATTDEPQPTAEGVGHFLRKGVVVALAILWNAPMMVVFYLLFTGVISERTMKLLIILWAATIPFAMIATAYARALQRLLFVSEFDVARIRPQLFGTAILWIVLSAIGFVSVVFGV